LQNFKAASMPWYDFFWYDENLKKISEHGITPEEFEEVVMAASSTEDSNTGSDMVRGETSARRFLVCIFTMIDDMTVMPITAYEPTKGNE